MSASTGHGDETAGRGPGEGEQDFLPPLPDYLARPQAIMRMMDGRPFRPTIGYWVHAWATYARER
jgi:hypothetical protein